MLPTQAQDIVRAAPDFVLVDINNNKVSLSDFRGKIVYIDFWASWCGPCVKEIPSSKKLQESFKDNPSIVFINISFDHDTSQWKKIIKAKKMTGIQLLSPKGKESNILYNYNVQTIPRTYIIGKNGTILDADAPLPRDKNLLNYLDTLLKQ